MYTLFIPSPSHPLFHFLSHHLTTLCTLLFHRNASIPYTRVTPHPMLSGHPSSRTHCPRVTRTSCYTRRVLEDPTQFQACPSSSGDAVPAEPASNHLCICMQVSLAAMEKSLISYDFKVRSIEMACQSQVQRSAHRMSWIVRYHLASSH